ncbi:MAG: hypothetical protein R3D98_15410 [Candidatus Krumholzibacteriia bacterium]
MSKLKITKNAAEAYSLSQETRSEIELNLEDAERIEADTSQAFDTFFNKLTANNPLSWDEFKSDFLLPLVSELGARTYDLISGENETAANTEVYTRFLDRFPKEVRQEICAALSNFLSARNRPVRRFVLSRMSATFLVRSTALPDGALDALAKSAGDRLEMFVFVDTNFLFSLIGLHDNPADDVVSALESIGSVAGGRVDVKLYVLPITIEEARNTIAYYQDKLSRGRITPQLAKSVQKATPDLSGITLKYLRTAAESEKPLSAQDYFDPYLRNLVRVCRGNGVELYNEKIDALRKDQEVLDDLLAEMKRQETYRAKGAKPYATILHDMVLWHFTRRKRAAHVEDPASAKYWVATLDFGMLHFDRHKRRSISDGVNVAIHPTVLLQILQFWVPQSEELEVALIDAIQPLLPHEFDGQSERVTLNILGVLSRFENASDLDDDTIGGIFLNDAVRTRIQETEDIGEQIEIIESAVVERVKKVREENAQLEDQISKMHQILEATVEKLNDMEEGGRREREQLAQKLQTESEEKSKLADTLQKLTDKMEREREARLSRLRHVLFGVYTALCLAFAVFAGIKWIAPWLMTLRALQTIAAYGVVTLFCFASALVLIELTCRRYFSLLDVRIQKRNTSYT